MYTGKGDAYRKVRRLQERETLANHPIGTSGREVIQGGLSASKTNPFALGYLGADWLCPCIRVQ
jgi:hypothetical protein